MKPEELKKLVFPSECSVSESVLMLENEIDGAAAYRHFLSAGDQIYFPAEVSFARILFLLNGAVTFSQDEKSWQYAEKAVFVSHPQKGVTLSANENSLIIEIRWEQTASDLAELESSKQAFPFTERYLDAEQYRDPFKSKKTISRSVVPQRIIPRFAMGTCEMHGDDLLGQHEHPLLDQFFITFSENDIDLLIDDDRFKIGGNTILHIPLGCNHGAETKGLQCAHYLWIDFIFDEKGVQYLDEMHIKTGEMESF